MSRLEPLLRKHAPLAAGLAPIASVALAMFIGPALGPATIRADDADNAADAALALEPLPAKVIAARDAAQRALAEPMGASPFARGAALSSNAGDDAPATTSASEAPAFAVSAILADRKGGPAIAVVNGKVRRVGDVAAPGWTVASIDAAAGEVALTGPEGQRATASTRTRPR